MLEIGKNGWTERWWDTGAHGGALYLAIYLELAVKN